MKPFAVGSLASSPAPSGPGYISKNATDFGLDAKWAPVRAVSIDLTVNTDFGETEADDLQTNLTRFSLFQAEKREFFLENSGIFEFGPGAAGAGSLSVMSVGALSFGSSGSSGSAPLLKLFHSRADRHRPARRQGADRLRRPHDRPSRTLEHGAARRADRRRRGADRRHPVSADQFRGLPRQPQPRRAVGGRDDLHGSRRRKRTAIARMGSTSIFVRTNRWRSTATPRAHRRRPAPLTRTTGRPG